jgi:hypothetical protein
MKRVILTSLSGVSLRHTDLAEVVIPFTHRLVGGPLPPPEELAAYVGERSDKPARGYHWSDFVSKWHLGSKSLRDLSLVEFCEPCESVELWFDPDPNDQLQLIWLLDCFRSHPEMVAKLRLRIIDYNLTTASEKELVRWKTLGIIVTEAELQTASMSWQAYRAATPEACFGLLRKDLSALPMLRLALIDLLEELPLGTTGLGATEGRFLELIARGYERTNALFCLSNLRQRRVFNELELGLLLEGLAHGPTPAVAGLDDELRAIPKDSYNGRLEAYRRSRLTLTEFGKSVLAYQEDFSRHNPIERWWGGTKLSNDRLWRLDTVLIAPAKP